MLRLALKHKKLTSDYIFKKNLVRQRINNVRQLMLEGSYRKNKPQGINARVVKVYRLPHINF